MKHILFLSCLLISTYASPKDRKISLEDIERDYLASERAPKPVKTPKVPTSMKSPSKFGFVPTRTASSYAQQSPKQSYTQTQYTVQSSQQQTPKPYIQYATEAPMTYQQQYTQQYVPQQYVPQQYYYQPTQYQQYENVQYVTDNNINSQDTQQYYNTPQYIYFQQYQAPSTSVQTVVDPKGIQYVMYVPAYQNSVADEQSYSKYSTGGSSQYAQEVPQVEQQVQYVSVPQKYTTVVEKEVPKYTQEVQKYTQQIGKSQYSKGSEYLIKREPKSLLDSYVPSILQIKYLQEIQKGLQSKRNS